MYQALFLVLCFIVIATPIRLRKYNQTADYQQLESRFAQYQKDVDRLSAIAFTLQKDLPKYKSDSEKQAQVLQEAMAEERDILTNMEAYLRIPYNLSRCDCLNLTSEQQSKLRDRATLIKQSIKKLNDRIDQNGDSSCPQREEIDRQTRRLTLYTDSVLDSIDSDCCRQQEGPVYPPIEPGPSGNVDVSNHRQITNLNATNWVYGGLTAEEVKLDYFNKLSQSNVVKCPVQAPYASRIGCMNCLKDLPYWSLKLGQCIKCPEGSNFNEKEHECWGSDGAVIQQNTLQQQTSTVRNQTTTKVQVADPLLQEQLVVDPVEVNRVIIQKSLP